MAIETNSIAVIPLTLFSALFAVSLTLYLTFLIKSKELGERRDKYVIKFIKPYFEEYAKEESAKEESQNKQLQIIGDLSLKTRYRIFFGDVNPNSFMIAAILFVIATALSILLAFYYNWIILIIDIIIGVSGGVLFLDGIVYFIRLLLLIKDTNNVKDT